MLSGGSVGLFDPVASLVMVGSGIMDSEIAMTARVLDVAPERPV